MDSERGTPEVLLIEIVVSQPAVVDHRLSKNDSNIVLFTSNMHSHHILIPLLLRFISIWYEYRLPVLLDQRKFVFECFLMPILLFSS